MDGNASAGGVGTPRGPLLGRYRLGVVIGRGGMGTVYRGEDTRLGRPVAIKILAPHLAADPLFKGRLLAEARAAAGLPHPHIVQVLDVHGEEGSVVLVMELVEGETLRERLDRAPMPVAEAVEVAAQVAEALAFAHSRGIVHRDVKPHNVLLREAPPESSAVGSGGRPLVWAKLADFGIARAVDATSTLTAAGMVLGSAPYLAPELLEGEAASPESDVYALAVTLFQMLTGRLPFEGGTATASLGQRLTAEAPRVAVLRPEVPAWLDGLVAHALARSKASRLSDAAAVARRLRDPHGAETETLALPGVPRTPRVPAERGRERRPTLKRTLAVGLAAMATAAVALVAVNAAAPRAPHTPAATQAPTAPTGTPVSTATPVGPPTPTAVVIRRS